MDHAKKIKVYNVAHIDETVTVVASYDNMDSAKVRRDELREREGLFDNGNPDNYVVITQQYNIYS